MRKYTLTVTVCILVVIGMTAPDFARDLVAQAQSTAPESNGQADFAPRQSHALTVPAGVDAATGIPQSEGGAYYAKPLPPVPDDGSKTGLEASDQPAFRPSSTDEECYEYINNTGFENNGSWFGQPASNVGFNTQSWYTGARSVFLNTNFYSDSALWQTVQVPADIDSALLSLHAALIAADPGETIYVSIYNESFSQLLYWDFLTFNFVNTWKNFAAPIPIDLIAGRTIQVTFQYSQDYDGFYSEAVFDDVSLVLCSNESMIEPTQTPLPTSTPQPTNAAATATATPRPTLLPTNTPAATPMPATPVPGAAIDLTIAGLQLGQAIMAETDPVTNLAVPLIAGKPALVRAYVQLNGVDEVQNLDGTLFVRDAQDQVHQVASLNGPIHLIGDSTEGSPGSTLNFLLDIAWLQGEIDLWAQVDPANLIPESNENNNLTQEISRVFQPGKKVRIAWVETNANVDRTIAQTGDADLRKFYPGGANDIEYFFQPGFNQFLGTSLTVQSYPEYLNALNRFWDRMTHEGNWVGGTPPDRLYGWAGGISSGLCGVADARWAGGRGRVVVGYAVGCGAETMAHEIGHVFNDFGLRHTPNRSREQDPNCIAPPGGPEPAYPNYPNLPQGSIGVTGFDATRNQILYPTGAYDFMSYCAPEWISPFNYIRMTEGFGPTTAVHAAETQEVTTKLLVSGLVHNNTFEVDLDPFYVIRSDVPVDEDSGEEFCVEQRDENATVLAVRCFDLGFVNIETGLPTAIDGFSLVMPYPEDTTNVVLTRQGEVLADREVSRNAPFVRLTSPTAGAALSGDSVTVTWNGADLDDDSLFYSLAYSIDSGASWLPLAADLTESSVEVDLTNLPGSSQVQFRVGASDGVNTTYAASNSLEIGSIGDATITVSGKAPTAAIRTNATRVDAGAAVALEGTGYDLEDGLLPEGDLVWWSNRDGELGTGSWLRRTLSTGIHEIALTVTDSDGNTDTATKTLTVGGTEGSTVYLPFVTRR